MMIGEDCPYCGGNNLEGHYGNCRAVRPDPDTSELDPRAAERERCALIALEWGVDPAVAFAIRDHEGDRPRPIAWSYELATWIDRATGEYSGWHKRVAIDRPNVPPRSIRNLRPLYAGPVEST